MAEGSHPYHVQNIQCPSCQEFNAKAINHTLDIPHYNDFVMININCPDCGYRISDFYNLNSLGHTIYKYSITGIEDDSTKVARSRDGTVTIPELEISIEPYGGGSTWIRNIEGILLDIKEKLSIMLKDNDDRENLSATKRRLKKLKKMLNYEIPFTLIVEDPNGNSLILPADEKKLTKEVKPNLTN